MSYNYGGRLRAFDPDSGSELWSRGLGTDFISNLPNVGHGMVYIAGYQTGFWIYAVDQASGKLVWKRAGTAGPSPVVSTNSVFLANECRRSSFDPLTGKIVWQFRDPSNFCSTPENAPVYRDRLYVRRGVGSGPSFRVVVDVFEGDTGAKAANLFGNAIWPPVISNDVAYLTADNVVRARSVLTKNILWQFPLAASPAMPPIVVNRKLLLLLSTGELLVIDRMTGQQLQTLPLRDAISFPTGVTAGFGAGQGMLLVPAGDQLFALRPAKH